MGYLIGKFGWIVEDWLKFGENVFISSAYRFGFRLFRLMFEQIAVIFDRDTHPEEVG